MKVPIRGRLPEETIGFVMQELRNLQDNFSNADVEPMRAQLATPASSHSRVGRANSVATATPSNQRNYTDERLAAFPTPQTAGGEPPRPEPTPSSPGHEPASPAHNRRRVEAVQRAAATCPEVSEGSLGSDSAIGPDPHTEATPREPQANGVIPTTSVVEAHLDTNHQFTTDEIMQGYSMSESEDDVAVLGQPSGNLLFDHVGLEDFDFQFDIMPEPQGDFEFPTLYSAGQFDLEDLVGHFEFED
ncbi:hypothetical protein PG994_012945 [Apiospora phragmitis]|uniref:Uncharacterized protein n=1 Tax=Apiospora phragmitis TaxID=2905665 RepID=A0ABR1T786_9PEZI